MKQCSICGQLYTEYGNNAAPINDGQCCDYCDCLIVLPTRIYQMTKQPRENWISFGQSMLEDRIQRAKERKEGI